VARPREDFVTRTSLPAAITEVAARDPVLAHLVALVGPTRHRPRDPDGHFGAFVRSIVFQQLAGRAAQAIHQRVRSTVGDRLTPETLTAVPDNALRAAGLSANKLASLRDLSAKILDGTVDLDRSSRLSDDELIAALAWRLLQPPSAKELGPLGDRFRPYRSIAARYCWAAVALFRGGTDPSRLREVRRA
jgi:DNA-3-methyladenine glycosylase II